MGDELTACLDEEREDISGHEDASQPATADEQGVIAIDQENDPCEFHINGCGEQSWSDQEENALDDVWPKGIRISVLSSRSCAANIANGLDCGEVSLI